MKTNHKILSLALFIALVLQALWMFVYKPKQPQTSEPFNKYASSTYLPDSLLNQIDTTIVFYNSTKDITYKYYYLLRFNSSAQNGYKTFLKINNNSATINGTNQLVAIELNTPIPTINTIHIYSLKDPLPTPSVPATDTLFSEKLFDPVNTNGYPDLIIRSSKYWRIWDEDGIDQINSNIVPYTGGPGSVIRQIVTWPPSLSSQHYRP